MPRKTKAVNASLSKDKIKFKAKKSDVIGSLTREEIYDDILMPLDDADIYSYAEKLAKEKGFSDLTEKDIEKIIHESRGIK
ncbi:MAG: hypothetical protein AAB116_02545 [Candidatus Poribacteria bacterium]